MVSQPRLNSLELESASKDPGGAEARKTGVVKKQDVDEEALKSEKVGEAGESGEPEELPEDVGSSWKEPK
jgi:uncharacterized membrane protein YdbT with pleckstrin-like domain